MALTGKKYENFYITTGSGADKVDSKKLTNATNAWAVEKAEGCKKYVDDPILSPIVFQLQQMQDELDALRTEISSNKSKATFPGFGTSSNTALAGDTTTISVSEQRAIALNTAKTTFPGFGTSNSTALVGDTNIVTIGSNTTIAFGDMITTQPKKGKPTYSIVMTVTNGGVSKAITLTLA